MSSPSEASLALRRQRVAGMCRKMSLVDDAERQMPNFMKQSGHSPHVSEPSRFGPIVPDRLLCRSDCLAQLTHSLNAAIATNSIDQLSEL